MRHGPEEEGVAEHRVWPRACDEWLEDEIHDHEHDAQPDQEFPPECPMEAPSECGEEDPNRQEDAAERARDGHQAHHPEQRVRPAVQPEQPGEIQVLHQRRCHGAARIWMACVCVSAFAATIEATTSR